MRLETTATVEVRMVCRRQTAHVPALGLYPAYGIFTLFAAGIGRDDAAELLHGSELNRLVRVLWCPAQKHGPAITGRKRHAMDNATGIQYSVRGGANPERDWAGNGVDSSIKVLVFTLCFFA